MADGDRHKNPHVVGVRGATPDLADAVRERAKDAGHGSLSELTVRFWRWYLRQEGVTLPKRPSKEQD
jgi:hypothetical protein